MKTKEVEVMVTVNVNCKDAVRIASALEEKQFSLVKVKRFDTAQDYFRLKEVFTNLVADKLLPSTKGQNPTFIIKPIKRQPKKLKKHHGKKRKSR